MFLNKYLRYGATGKLRKAELHTYTSHIQTHTNVTKVMLHRYCVSRTSWFFIYFSNFSRFWILQVLFVVQEDYMAQCNRRIQRTCFYILVATQFRLRDDSFGRLQLFGLSHVTEFMRVYPKRTIVTASEMNHRTILIGSQVETL